VTQNLTRKFPVRYLLKQGQRGKAFSVMEGAAVATAPYVAMIDGDLQYPPEVLPDMFRLTQQYGMVVARRHDFHENKFRQVFSQGFRWFFGKVLNGLSCDVQSGL